MQAEGNFRRRHLPHWDVEGRPFFVTACLAGRIPASGLSRILKHRNELNQRPRPQQYSFEEWEHAKHKLLFKFVDDLLDRQPAVRHLEDPRQAQIVFDAFLHFSDERYALLAFVVMPSHIHWLFRPDESWSLEALRKQPNTRHRRTPREIIVHSVQSYTATMCNRIRGGAGSYWQSETFDHWARDDEEMMRIIDYIESNPLKAGLVTRAEDWPWSSARVRANANLRVGDRILRSHVG